VNSLMISSTVWVVYWIHCHTTNVWVQLTLGLSLVMGCTRCSQWHLESTMTGENADGCTTFAVEGLTLTTGHTDSNLVSEMCLYLTGVSCSSRNLATVTGADFDVIDLSSFWNR
jgi:hypothetical protein